MNATKRRFLIVILILMGYYIASIPPKTKPMGTKRIFYNRIPKTGSSFFKTLLTLELSSKNDFDFSEDNNSMLVKRKISGIHRQNMLKESIIWRLNQTKKTIFTQHVPFIKLDLLSLSYINLIRDPVRRVQSSYCYKRDLTKKRGKEMYRAIIKKSSKVYANKWLKLPLSQCIKRKKLKKCISTDTLFQTITFFCGIQDPVCQDPNTDAALAKAIDNMDKYYSVVGVLEETRKFLTVLEHKIPDFFSGAIEQWEKMQNEDKVISNKCGADLPPVTPEDAEVIKNVLKREYKIYNYAVQKLDQQYRYYLFTSNSTY